MVRAHGLVIITALALALAPLLLSAQVASADPGDESGVSGGYSGGYSGGDYWQTMAGVTIIMAADLPATVLTIGCMGCPAAEFFDIFVAMPATIFGVYLIIGENAEASAIYFPGDGGGGSW